MKRLLQVAGLAIALAICAVPSRAVPIIGGAEEALFVSSTTLTSERGVPYALCLRTRTWRFLAIPFWRSADGAALSPASCNTDSLTPVTETQRIDGIEGVRPWTLQRADSLSPTQLLSGFWGWLVLPFLVVPYWVYRAYARKETAGRDVLLETMDHFTQVLSQTLGLIAGHHGRLTRHQFARIRALVVEKTGENVGQQEVIEMALPADRPLSEVDISGLATSLTPAQRLAVADAVQQLISDMPEENGRHGGSEVSAFAARLFDALGIPDAAPEPENTGPGYFPATSPAE